jgi:peptidoglycan hydrolase-like protein with peptidoglycan-binding domain
MDIRDLIQKADAYGKQSEQTQKQIEEGLLDWFKEKLGLGDTAAQAAVAAAQATGADPEETPNTPPPGTSTTTQGNTVGQSDPNNNRVDPNVGTTGTPFSDFDDPNKNPQQGQAGSDNPTPQGTPGSNQNQQPATPDDANANPEPEQNQKDLMTRYNEGGKQAMPEIEKLQQDLKDLGFDPNGVDGKYGNGTFKAVQEFQKANGLQVDGQAGSATLAKIEQVKAGGAQDGGTGATASGDQGDGTRGSDTAQANPTPTDGDPGETQANAPDAETQRLIDELNDLINQMMPRGQTVSASADQDSITAMRGAINLAESLLREATEEQKAKLSDLLNQLGNSNWAQSNADAYQTMLNRANAAMAASPSATRASAPATPTDGDPGTQAQPQATRGPDDGNRGGQQPNNLGPDGQRDGDDLGNAPTAPKVSKETFIQMAPNRPADQANMNVSQMKAKYPTPYVDIPNKDGTVTRGYGPLKNLQDFVANKGKRLNAKIIGQQNASKEYDMTKKINEGASMNITADNASELAELLGILKNAGMPNAAPVADMHIDMPMAHDAMHTDIDSHKQGPMPCATCGGDHGEDTPCGGGEEWDNSPDEGYGDMMDIIKLSGGPNSNKNPGDIRVKDPRQNDEEVEEDGWDNSPDEEYKDDDYMYQSGGIHKKKKSHPPVAGGDNPMALENSIKAQLYKALEEKLQNK